MAKSVKEVQFCRICMDDESSGLLISPCRCSGSLSHVHEQCLKTWLASKQSDMGDSKCEICKTKLLMKFVLRRRCNPREAFNEGITQCLFLPLLLGVMSILFFIIYVLTDKMIHDPGDAKEQGYSIGLIIVCSLSFLAIIILVVNAFSDACLTRDLQDWRIFNQHFENQHLFEGENIEFQISEMPPVIRIRGRKVKTLVHVNNNISGRSRVQSTENQEPNLENRRRRFTFNRNSDNSPQILENLST